MEFRPLDITVISAEGVKNVNTFSKMDVYAVVWVDRTTKRKTHVDKSCGRNPRWDHRISFSLDESNLSHLTLLFRLLSHRSFFGDRTIGDVSVPVADLFSAFSDDKAEREVEYRVRTISGKAKGTLKFSYRFGEKFSAVDATVKKSDESAILAYPAGGYAPPPPPSSGMGYAHYPPHAMVGPYPPVPSGYPLPAPTSYGGYPPAPAYGGGGYASPTGGYGYPGHSPPPPVGYGYYHHQLPPPPAVVPPESRRKKKSKGIGGGKFGLGLGAGAGLLGGLLIGEAISDVGDVAAYDAGFEDGIEYGD